jgi:hypothetical protein
VSITASGQTAIEASEAVGTVKPAILPAAVFIIVEVVLVAETISVILFKDMDLRNPGAAPITVLLSVALLANLGLVCGVAAAIAAESVRRSNRARARALSSSFPAVSAPAEGVKSPSATPQASTSRRRKLHPSCPLAGRRRSRLVGSLNGCQPRRHPRTTGRVLRHQQGVDGLELPGGDVMTAMYGVLAAIPMVWGYAGYVMVSHPGTAEADVPSGLRKVMSRVGK